MKKLKHRHTLNTSPELLLDPLRLVVLRRDGGPGRRVLRGSQKTQVLEGGGEGPVAHAFHQLQHQRLHHSTVLHQPLHNAALDHRRSGGKEEGKEMYRGLIYNNVCLVCCLFFIFYYKNRQCSFYHFIIVKCFQNY